MLGTIGIQAVVRGEKDGTMTAICVDGYCRYINIYGAVMNALPIENWPSKGNGGYCFFENDNYLLVVRLDSLSYRLVPGVYGQSYDCHGVSIIDKNNILHGGMVFKDVRSICVIDDSFRAFGISRNDNDCIRPFWLENNYLSFSESLSYYNKGSGPSYTSTLQRVVMRNAKFERKSNYGWIARFDVCALFGGFYVFEVEIDHHEKIDSEPLFRVHNGKTNKRRFFDCKRNLCEDFAKFKDFVDFIESSKPNSEEFTLVWES